MYGTSSNECCPFQLNNSKPTSIERRNDWLFEVVTQCFCLLIEFEQFSFFRIIFVSTVKLEATAELLRTQSIISEIFAFGSLRLNEPAANLRIFCSAMHARVESILDSVVCSYEFSEYLSDEMLNILDRFVHV